MIVGKLDKTSDKPTKYLYIVHGTHGYILVELLSSHHLQILQGKLGNLLKEYEFLTRKLQLESEAELSF